MLLLLPLIILATLAAILWVVPSACILFTALLTTLRAGRAKILHMRHARKGDCLLIKAWRYLNCLGDPAIRGAIKRKEERVMREPL